MSSKFFESKLHPGLWMNKHGVVFAPRGHEAANEEIYRCLDWPCVPLKSGFLSLRCEIEDEAYASGYRRKLLKNGFDCLWSKPGREVANVDG